MRCLVALLGLVSFCTSSNAQILYGSLTGNVTDPSQAAVPNATVQALNVGTSVEKETTTNSEGVYLFRDLQPGAYRVTISSPSFGKAVQEGVEITANQLRRVDIALQVAQVSTSVVVSGTSESLQTDRADVNTNITSREVTGLPVTGSNGRNFQSLMTIVPGSIMAGEQNSAAGNPQRAISFNMNGVSRLQNNTKIDGSSDTYPWLPTNIAYVPPAESIETANVVTNSFSAELGQAGGAAVNVITKSGTNEFHGSGWIYDTNSHFKARNFFQTTPQNPKNILNQFGLTFGGPVWIPKVFNGKNKLFFFVDWERTTVRNTSPIRFYSLPTAALRAGDFTAPGVNATIYDPASSPDPRLRTAFAGNKIPSTRIDSASAQLISLLPQPNVAGATYTNNYTASGTGTYDRDNIDVKINHHPTDRLAYFGRYSRSPSLIFDPPALGAAGGDALNGGQNGNAPGLIQVIGAGITYTVSPTIVIDANAGYTRQRLGAQNIDINTNYGLDVLKIPGTNGPNHLQGGIPFFNVSNWANIGNANTGNPFLFRDNQYVANANLGWFKGTHSMRFGWDYQNQQLNHFQPQGGTFQTPRGTFQFNGSSTELQGLPAPADVRFNSWADFLLGDASGAGKSDQFVNPDSVRMHTYAVYAQDQWQVNRKLTVNYGLRWEWYPFPRSDHGGVSRFDPATGNVYVGGRGGVPDDTYASSGPGEFLPRVGVAYRATENTVIRSGFGLSADPKPFIDFRNAYPIVSNWQMPAITFNGATNAFLPVTTLRQGLNTAFAGIVDLNKGVIPLPVNVGTTTFPKDAMRKYIESWNFFVQHQFNRAFTAQAGYVGTRAVGQEQFVNINASAPGTGNNGVPLFPITAGINDIMPYKTTTYDALQSQLTGRWGDSIFGAVYTLSKAINWADNDANPRIQYQPAANLNRGIASYDRTHNFQGYWVLESPFSKGHHWAKQGFTGMLLGGWQLNGILSAESGQPIYVIQNTSPSLLANGSSQVPNQVKSQVAILGGIGLGHPYFDTTAYAVENGARFGNAGRNNIRGPGFFNIDAGLLRRFPIKERFNIEFRADALNILNHTNFPSPGTNGAGGNDISTASAFGYITSTLGSNAVLNTGERQFRFAARVAF
jgi:hypothetical protein